MDRVKEVSYLIAITGRARRQARPAMSTSWSHRGREAEFVLSHLLRAPVPVFAKRLEGQITGEPVRPAEAANGKRASA